MKECISEKMTQLTLPKLLSILPSLRCLETGENTLLISPRSCHNKRVAKVNYVGHGIQQKSFILDTTYFYMSIALSS